MRSVAAPRILDLATAADYLALTKPKVVTMILLATAAGFAMGSPAARGGLDFWQMARALFGTALAAGGALALNQYLERDIDSRMRRTFDRPLPSGRMQALEALAFGGALSCAGLGYLSLAVSPVAGMITALTLVSYLFLYTPMKRRSALCTVVGAFPGALPPLTGYTAAGGALDAGAAVLFGILFFWQLPHSLAIAHLYREDYERAGVKLLPTVDRQGGSTGRQAVLNALALLAAGLLPAMMGLTGRIAFVVALAAGLWLLAEASRLALSGTASSARRLLLATYVYVPLVFVTMALDRMGP